MTVQVSRKPNVPYFGPLFNEVIVDQRSLPGLVRATAINASRAKRSMLPHFQSHYEERFFALDQIVKNHKEKSTYEDFVASVFSPAALTNLFTTGSSQSGAGSQDYQSSSRPSSVMSSSDYDHHLHHPGEAGVLRPRARTDASALRPTMDPIGDSSEPDAGTGSSPKNLKKLTAAIRANINNNVARVNRPMSSRDPGDILTSGQPQSSPPGGNTKRR